MTSPDRIEELLKEDERRELIEHLLEEHQNDFDGSEDLAVLMHSRYAVIFSRSSDAWVLGANDLDDIAGYELGVLSAEYDVEWVDSVIDLTTGEPLYYQARIAVTVTDSDGNSVTVDNKP